MYNKTFYTVSKGCDHSRKIGNPAQIMNACGHFFFIFFKQELFQELSVFGDENKA